MASPSNANPNPNANANPNPNPNANPNPNPNSNQVYNGVFLESVPYEAGARHEVARCSPDQPGEWRGEWEACVLLKEGP